jgi:5-methylcytosine-specific restriction protein A
VRLAYLSDHPICEQCESFGHVANADVVDHIVSIEDDPSRRLDPTNFRALCKSHHDARTMRDQVKRRRA